MFSNRKFILGLSIILALLSAPGRAQDLTDEIPPDESSDWRVDRLFLYTSVYTRHFGSEQEHNNKQRLIGIEAIMTNNWMFGFANFDNSFSQRSAYLYAGYQWPIYGSKHLYMKVTGGLLYGYKEPYADRVLFNDLGVAPVLLPALGFRYKYFVAEASLAGLSVLLITAGVTF